MLGLLLYLRHVPCCFPPHAQLRWSIGGSDPYTCSNTIYGALATPLTAKLLYTDQDGIPKSVPVTISTTGTYAFTVTDLSDAASSTVSLEITGLPTGWSYTIVGGSSWTVTRAGNVIGGSLPTTSKIADSTVARPFQVGGKVHAIKVSQASATACVESNVAPAAGATTVTVAGSPLTPAEYALGSFTKSVLAPVATGSVLASVGAVNGQGYIVDSRFLREKIWTADADFYTVTDGKDNRCLGNLPPACLNVGYEPKDVQFSGPVNWEFNGAPFGCSYVTVELQKLVGGVWVSFATPITTMTNTGTYTLTVPAAQFDELDVGATYQVVIKDMGANAPPTAGPVTGSVGTTTAPFAIGTTAYTVSDLKVTRKFKVKGALRYDMRATKTNTFAPASCTDANARAFFNIPDWSPAFPSTTFAKVCVDSTCTDDSTAPLSLAADGTFEQSLELGSAAMYATTSALPSSASRIDDSSSTFLTTTPDLRTVFLGSTTTNDVTISNLCLADYAVCLTLGVRPITAGGNIEWSFPNSPDDKPAFTCEAVTFTLSAPNVANPSATSPVTIDTADQALTGQTAGAYAFDSNLDRIPPGITLTVGAEALESTTASYVSGTSDSESSNTAAWTVDTTKVTRQFKVKGALRYDMHATKTNTFAPASCATATRAFFNIPDWSPAFPSTTFAKVCVDSTCTDDSTTPLSLAADGTFEQSLELGSAAMYATTSALPSSASRIDDSSSTFLTTTPDLRTVFLGSTTTNDVTISNLCLADYAVCLTLGVRPITAGGNIEWSFPNSPDDKPAFTCEAVTFTLSAPNVANPSATSPVTIDTADQALTGQTAGAYAFDSNLDRIPPGITLTVGAEALESTTASYVSGTSDSESSNTAAWTVDTTKVTRTFSVAGMVRYDLRASPSKTSPTADKCNLLEGSVTSISASFPKFPDVPTYAQVSIGTELLEAPAFDNVAGTFTKSGIALGTDPLAATLATSSNLLDTHADFFRTTSGDLMDLFKADLCGETTPVCLTVGLLPATACGQTKWELNNDITTADLDLEKTTTCFSSAVSLSATLGTITSGPTVSGDKWCFTVKNIPPGSSVTPSMADGAAYDVLADPTVPVQGAVTVTSTSVTIPTPFYITRTFKLQGPVDFDFRAELPQDTCPAHANWPNDSDINVTSTVTGSSDLYSGGLFTIPTYSFDLGDVTFIVDPKPSTPPYFTFDANLYKKIRSQSVAQLISAFGTGDMCANDATINVPCLSVGKSTVNLSGQIWIEMNQPFDNTVQYSPTEDRTFPCAIKVVITAVPDTGSFIIVNGAPVTTATVTSIDGAFSATVVSGGQYTVTPLTFQCDEHPNGQTTTGVANNFDLVLPNYPVPATANEGNNFVVNFPYRPNNNDLAGCGHTLGFWKNQAANCITDTRTQYTRPEFLPILDALIAPKGYMRTDVLHFPRNETYITACKGGQASLETKCSENWKFQYVINIINDEKTDLAKLLRQLLSNEIATKAGYIVEPKWMAEVIHQRGEFAAWNFATNTGLYTGTQINSLASYYDKLNNYDPKPCAANLINSAPGTQIPLPDPKRRRAATRRMAL
ncbi:hypothetical protein HYH03_018768 [Edaphochlamys debaryana]|uniref:Uncharacterized protein n=1 Tax=Edaphochlamys debaryana TaxID=47281 RepID=A0A836BP19_9CHLO|nr:hypothetical protein HYH03_018768 [Edaphochlamys debaryana]|eukprot:KAG2482304.1 hypothetical protein HYH03_018768 [Edaphochlamys debaryana]